MRHDDHIYGTGEVLDDRDRESDEDWEVDERLSEQHSGTQYDSNL